jgi:long-chain acyl-CoA synthetase
MGAIISGARRVTADTIQGRAERAAAGFAALGVGAGDLIALYLRNDVAFLEASLAAGRIGAYPTPVNWHYAPAEARYLFENSGAKAIVIHADLVAGVREALPPGVPVLIVRSPPEIVRAYALTEGPFEAPPGALDWDDWIAGLEPYDGPAVAAPGTVIYTSGTTGHPKGVRRNPPTPEQAARHTAILARGFGFTPQFGQPAEWVTVITGPMYHSAPNAYGLLGLRMGATVILQPRFDPEELLALIEAEQVTHLHMVPIMFNRLLRLPDAVRRRYDLSSLRFVVHAAAPCPTPVKQAMIEWWGPVINEYYGATEVGMVTFCTAEEWLAHKGTVGRALPEAEVVILDAQGRPLPAGAIGEVACGAHGIADFTYHGDDAKRRATEKAGLITPGDIGYLDDDGFLHLCDRAKDMIISGGANIYPAEIEAELHRMPGVADCGVFGIPDEEFGETVCAVVQPQPGVLLTAASVRAFLRERMAGYKVPKRVDFHVELPREDSGKIFKRKLREPFWAGLERRI